MSVVGQADNFPKIGFVGVAANLNPNLDFGFGCFMGVLEKIGLRGPE